MGWTFFQDNPQLSRAQIIERELSQPARPDNPLAWGFDSIAERGAVVYAIAWHDAPGRPRAYFGLVVLTQRGRGDFGYKEMDETVHPFYYDMPARMLARLEKLSPDCGEQARAWRDKCHEHRKKARKTWQAGDRASLGDGWIYTLERPAAPRHGWHVVRNDGNRYRMTAQQLARAEKTDEPPTKHTTKEVSAAEFFAGV